MGWVVILLIARENFRNILFTSLYVYLSVLFLLILVLVAGKEVSGSRRWLDLGIVHVQPSEFMKFALLILTAHILPHVSGLLDGKLFLLVLAYAMPAVITLKQPDLGTTVAYFVPLTAMVFALGVRVRYFVIAGLVFFALSPFLWSLLKDYQKRRLLAVIDPYSDYLGSGYQLIQSVIAVGSGGLTGKGVGQGTQSKLLFLPEAHTDFIFSVIAEELGFIGAGLLILSFFLFLLRILLYLKLPLDTSAQIFVVGAFALLLFQISANVLMALGMFPVVGMPLPFVSFGGSATITMSLIVGALLSVKRTYS